MELNKEDLINQSKDNNNSNASKITNYYNEHAIIMDSIRNKVVEFREISKNRKFKFNKNDLEKPVASWIKNDRMIDKEGYEFVVILRTSACSWARSEFGGCSMCGYFNDRALMEVTQDQIFNQFIYAMNKNKEKIDRISQENQQICFKLFSSGSIFDDSEITKETRFKILNHLLEFDCITEILFESRVEFIDKIKEELREIVGLIEPKNKKFIVALGIESMNDVVRNVFINKGTPKKQIFDSINIIKKAGALIKAYLLLKPPFLSERNAIFDTAESIKTLITLNVDIISINPGNIQAHTLSEYLFNHKKYRTPWIYSLFRVLQLSLLQNPHYKKQSEKSVIVCSPSAKGTLKGIHNCSNKKCNKTWLEHLEKFVLTQDLNLIFNNNLPYYICDCWVEYNSTLDYSDI